MNFYSILRGVGSRYTPCWVGKYYGFTVNCCVGNYCGFAYHCIVTYYSIVLYESNVTVITDLHITQSWDFYVRMHYTITVGNHFWFIPQCTGTTWWIENCFWLNTFETIFDLYPSAFLLWRVFQLNTSTRNYFGYGPEHLVMSQPILDLHHNI